MLSPKRTRLSLFGGGFHSHNYSDMVLCEQVLGPLDPSHYEYSMVSFLSVKARVEAVRDQQPKVMSASAPQEILSEWCTRSGTVEASQ